MRSKDRLAELRQLSSGTESSVYCATVEPAHKPPHAAEIDLIYQEVMVMRGWIHQMDGNTQLMRRLHADPTYHTNRQLQEQLESVVTSSNASGLKVCGALRQLEARVTSARARNDAPARIARLQYACARRHYARALHDHHAALDRVRDQQAQLLHEQIRLTNLSISDDECQSLLDSNNISLFVDNVRAETAEARRQLRDVEARHAELQRVEAALGEVRDLFLQLAHLVQDQQQRVDTVEYYALQATEHVGTGQDHLLKGTITRTKTRKKKLGLVLCLVTGLAVVLLVLIIT